MHRISLSKLILTISLLCPGMLNASGQSADSTLGSHNWSVNLHYGFLIAHRPTIFHLQTGHTSGFDISYALTTNGSVPWQSVYRNPEIGLSVVYINSGNNEHIGSCYGLYTYLNLLLAGNQSTSLNLKLGSGLGVVEKPFTQYDNFENNAIGSYLNVLINIRMALHQKVGKNTVANLSIGLTHLSNGSVVTPNLGLNFATAGIGITNYFGINSVITKHELQPFRPFTNWEIFAGAFSKQIYPALGENYFVASLLGNYKYNYSQKAAIAGGADFFYDTSLKPKLESENEYNTTTDIFRFGIHAGWHLKINRLTTGIDYGFYIYDQWGEDGATYQRLVLNYELGKHLIAGINLKTHYGKADYIELGLGWRK